MLQGITINYNIVQYFVVLMVLNLQKVDRKFSKENILLSLNSFGTLYSLIQKFTYFFYRAARFSTLKIQGIQFEFQINKNNFLVLVCSMQYLEHAYTKNFGNITKKWKRIMYNNGKN